MIVPYVLINSTMPDTKSESTYFRIRLREENQGMLDTEQPKSS